MASFGTVPLGLGDLLEIPSLVVEVIDGVDKGRSVVDCAEVLTVGTAEGNTLELTDRAVSRYHLELTATHGGVRVLDLESTNGTWLGEARIDRATVPFDATLKIGGTRLRFHDGQPTLPQEARCTSFGGLLGRGPAMSDLMTRLQKVAASEVAVLLQGESGTGKELIAHALHEASPRSAGPFVTVDCGAIPPTLISSELFGHERGAFTGAHRLHRGAIERADGGTLFLDEIGELSLDLQTHLLGILERRSLRRVGGHEDLPFEVRVVSATNRDLRGEVNRGTFRLDLFYRLAVVRLRVPALRDHIEDVPLLVEHFLRQAGYSGPVDEIVPRSVMATLRAHRWPGNVRELRNVVEACVAMGEPPRLLSSLPPAEEGRRGQLTNVQHLPYKQARTHILHEFESTYLKALLERSEGNVSRAAREAGMDRSYLIQLLRKHELS